MTGHYHNLAITSDDELWGWGSSSSGRLGAGFTTATVEAPMALQTPDNTRFYLLSANRNHSLAISMDGSIPYAWGRNDNGQLGNGTSGSVQSSLGQIIFNIE
jgi:alpha-tubulin suppressor-like RCC1 family protein